MQECSDMSMPQGMADVMQPIILEEWARIPKEFLGKREPSREE